MTSYFIVSQIEFDDIFRISVEMKLKSVIFLSLYGKYWEMHGMDNTTSSLCYML